MSVNRCQGIVDSLNMHDRFLPLPVISRRLFYGKRDGHCEAEILVKGMESEHLFKLLYGHEIYREYIGGEYIGGQIFKIYRGSNLYT
ncbi:MAG: hypothetical protein COW52_01585 [Nitrospirae bacterium CG17_big_fil_post_rev_8_21_14_2_50_50_9]|nr:MAG: hypothetical protein COW52_01585 [Nitrospirae bacterium CG17_big_fil_post_rev_8_21_14_2_50_50_9]